MFLKRIEMQGFKSFADKEVIEFNSTITGIVGPNGCGKSNISDAIKWVLGEQSVKNLRGEKMTDFIFSGAENRKAVSMAEVSLIFDNSNHLLNSDDQEIEVTRRIYAGNQDGEYLINRKNVRYKDIINLIVDCGLGKDSLSMISQGNITSFAEAKPYDRRHIFEDAAGVLKYKKAKIESLSKLERTKENLERAYDILNELEKQVVPLEKQAIKAKKYTELKEKLQEVEISVIVSELDILSALKQENESKLFIKKSELAISETTIQVYDNNIQDIKTNLRSVDKEISDISNQLMATIQNINTYEKQRVEVEQKRRYLIEMGTSVEKIANLKAMLNEALLEYENRHNRYNELKNNIELLNSNLDEILYQLANQSLLKEESSGHVLRIQSRIDLLENIIKDPFSSKNQSGVKAIMDNKHLFTGVLGVVGQELKPKAGYEEAISSALAGSIFHIMVKDEYAAKEAIEFLKRNKSGRASFLPLSVLKIKGIFQEDQIILNNLKGYLGSCDEFVSCDEKYNFTKKYLLGNTLMVDNIDNANNIAKTLKYRYKIVTIDGEILHAGGLITGGKIKNNISIVTAQAELNKLSQDIISYRANSEIASKKYNDLINSKVNVEAKITENRIAIAQLETILQAKKSRYEKLKLEYNEIKPASDEKDDVVLDDLTLKLNNLYSSQDMLNSSLKLKQQERIRVNNEIDIKEAQIKEIRKSLQLFNQDITELSTNIAKNDAQIESNLNRLTSVYSLTYEYAKENYAKPLCGDEKEQVIVLKKEIECLGNVNMNACQEFEEVKERYNFLKKNYDDLLSSRNKILDTIDELDKVMKEQFLDCFHKINNELSNTFKHLFGGGKASLILEDPDDILNTGIDIKCQPPGKEVKSIRLFSGGEKTLIAISVLFTILKIKPIPLIVFDEVEAALDQANVERFANYVKEFSTDSQFLIITHRPGTMARCSRLYGVTMQKRGISKMMKVELVEAIEMADEKENN